MVYLTGPLLMDIEVVDFFFSFWYCVILCFIRNKFILLTLISGGTPQKYSHTFKSIHDKLPEIFCRIWQGSPKIHRAKTSQDNSEETEFGQKSHYTTVQTIIIKSVWSIEQTRMPRNRLIYKSDFGIRQKRH